MKNLFIVMLLCPLLSWSQDKPYFQQEVNYTINASLNDEKHEIYANILIEYINNSPDELNFIWFHLWPNAYKNNHTPLGKQLLADGNKKFYYASLKERGWIDSLSFKVNGQEVKTEPGSSIDILKLVLNKPLAPGQKINISTPYKLHIPIGSFSRFGHIEQQYQITQWYPKPAVYDRYGWHPMPYLNQGEFYSEFGNFDVHITLPKNYVVGATGTLVNGADETAWLLQKVEETQKISTFDKKDDAFPASSSEKKTLHYTAQNVHDFAWFCDKRYHVLHDEVILPKTQKKVDTWVMFTNSYGDYWKKAAKYVSDAIYYYSLWNGDYPYPHATAVDGALSAGAGMEYPMITVIGASNSDAMLDQVIAHEVGHNWFYGILASNERDHAWMDEGVNSFNEKRYMEIKYPKDSADGIASITGSSNIFNIQKLLGLKNLDEQTLTDLAYRFNQVQKKTQPMDLKASEYTTINYGTVVYGYSAIVLKYLQNYLGENLYDQCAKAYYEKWKFKHPYPEDMKQVYEQVSEKDLSWFFDQIIPTTKHIDYKICSVKKSLCPESFIGDCWEVKIKNKGNINAPLPISCLKNNKIVSTNWYNSAPGTSTVKIYTMNFDQVKIDAQNYMPDMNRQNNTYKMYGIFKMVEPFQLKTLGLLPNTNKTQLFWIPTIGWNQNDKFMLGAALYNNLLPEKKLEFVVMPMYSFNNKDIKGGAKIHYNLHFDQFIQTLRIGVKAERYAYSSLLHNLNYNKIAPEIYIEFRKKQLNSPWKHSISLRQINIYSDEAVPVNGHFSIIPVYKRVPTLNQYADAIYTVANNRKINPFSASVYMQQSYLQDKFTKASVNVNYHWGFKKANSGFDFRYYAAAFLSGKNGNPKYALYSSDGPRYIGNGVFDYLYDYTYLDRSGTRGLLSHQYSESGGGLKVGTPIGASNTWITTLSIKYKPPVKIPVKFFADIAVSPNKVLANQVLYDGGLCFNLIQNIMEVYLPLIVSDNINKSFEKSYPKIKGFNKNLNMIRFTFNIQKLNPFELVKNINL